MNSKAVYKLLKTLCYNAYLEGRVHQQDDDCPEVGMYFPKNFEDTETFKVLEKTKPKE